MIPRINNKKIFLINYKCCQIKYFDNTENKFEFRQKVDTI